MSGIRNRFRLPTTSTPPPPLPLGEPDGNSNGGTDAMDLEEPHTPLPGAPIQASAVADVDDRSSFNNEHIIPPPSIFAKRRHKLVQTYSSSGDIDTDHQWWMHTFLMRLPFDGFPSSRTDFDCYHSRSYVYKYKALCRFPRFVARYRRATCAFVASWLCVLPVNAHTLHRPRELSWDETQKRTQKYRNDLRAVWSTLVNYVNHEFLNEAGNEYDKTHNILIESKSQTLVSVFLYDHLVAGLLYTALKTGHTKLAMACMTVLADMAALMGSTDVNNIVAHYIPSLNNTATTIMQRIASHTPPISATFDAFLPSDIPLDAFDGNKADMFEIGDRIRLFLAAPKRTPLEMIMGSPIPLEEFAFFTPPLDTFQLPPPSAIGRIPQLTPSHGGGGSGGDSRDAASQFIAVARTKVTELVGPASNLTTPAGIAMQPLCVRAWLDKATRGVGLKNPDRFQGAFYLRDIGTYDIEDLAELPSHSGFRNWAIKRDKHWRAQLKRYDTVIEENVREGRVERASPNCKAMQNLHFQRSEERGFYCPFVSTNNCSAEEIRSLLAMSRTDLRSADVEEIVQAALRGDQALGCVSHHNAELRATGDRVIYNPPRPTDKPITHPAHFVQIQAMRRSAGAPIPSYSQQ